MPTTSDPYATLRLKVLRSVLEGPGDANPSIRRAAAERTSGVPAELQALVDKIHDHAYKVTDDDIERLKAKYSDDELFEVVVSAALGASERRLLAGLEALRDA
jgi:hypothetical protein